MLIVTNYHYIREDFSAPFPSIYGVTPQQFRSQLEELSRYGSFISQEKLLNFRKRPIEGNYFLITFDDGLKEQYELAKPILDEMGIPFIFFINTSNFHGKEVSLVHKIHLLRSQLSAEDILEELGNSTSIELNQKEKALATIHYNYDPEDSALLKYLLNFRMSPEEQKSFIDPLFGKIFDESRVAEELYFTEKMIKDLERGDSLGSHSHRHLPLGQLSPEVLRNELEQTQDFFRREFGRISRSISYPFGSPEACRGISEEVRKTGFELGFTMERAGNKSLKENSLLLARYDCNDLPLGKNDLFRGENPFKNSLERKWQLHENNPVDQQ